MIGVTPETEIQSENGFFFFLENGTKLSSNEIATAT
jgi:hypothetical protein